MTSTSKATWMTLFKSQGLIFNIFQIIGDITKSLVNKYLMVSWLDRLPKYLVYTIQNCFIQEMISSKRQI